jgi:uncharacterized delta-60 repeat protein
MNKTISFISLWLIILFAATSACKSQPGTLDLSFNLMGYVADSVILPLKNIGGRTMVTQPDGKILVSAEIWVPTFKTRIYRYNEDGSPDQGFGTNGILELDFNSGTFIEFLALQSDEKIIGAGSGITEGGLSVWTVIRLNPDGSYDTSFGTDGVVETIFYGSTELAHCVRILPGGMLLVSGMVKNTNTNVAEFNMVRYLANGALDPTFGSDGITRYVTPDGSGFAKGIACLQSDGRIVLGGYRIFPGNHPQFTMMRFSPDGILDTSFGNNGLVIDSVGFGNISYSLTIQSDDKIVVPGMIALTDLNYRHASVSRYLADGTIDLNFADQGHYIGELGIFNMAMVQADGKILTLGNLLRDSTIRTPLVCRFLPSGLPDPDFGNNGIFILDQVLPGSLGSMDFDRNGKIVATGTCNENSVSGWNLLTLRLSSIATGADEVVAEPLLQLSPNPVIDHVTIRLNKPGQFKLTLLSMEGKQVLETPLTQIITTMDLGFLKPGVYFIRVNSPYSSITGKLVKL